MKHEDGAWAIDEYLRLNPDEVGALKNRKEVYKIMNSYKSDITIEANNAPPTDICWNSVNNKPGRRIYDDFEHWPHALIREGKMFRLVGTKIQYSGVVIHAKTKEIFGEWKNGKFYRAESDNLDMIRVCDE